MSDLPRWVRNPRVVVAVLAVLAVTALVVVFARPGGPVVDPEPPAASGPPTPVTPPSAETPVVGREFAVSPSGNDDADGTPADPWRTLTHALDQLRDGDRLTVGGGDYREDVQLDVHRGKQDRPVQVVAAEGARPVLHGLLWLADMTHWDVRGINVTWDDDNDSDQHMVKLTGGTDWTFADAELWGARSFAALLVDGKPRDFTLSGLYVHDTLPSNDTNQDHLIYLNCGMGGGTIERSVLAHSGNGRALKIGAPDSGGGRVGNVAIRYVTMVDNRGPSAVQLAYEVQGVRIENSIMVGSAPGRANVTAFDLKGKDNVVSNNVGWDSAGVLDDARGLTDGGGNVVLDPRLSGADSPRPYEPAEPRAQAYGRWAPPSS